MRCLLLIAAACAAWGQEMPARSMKAQPLPELNKMLAYRLTAKNLDKYIRASDGVTALAAKDPGLRQRMKADPKSAPKTLDESVAYAKEHFPAYYAAIERSGMSYREYTLFEGSLLLAWVANARPHPNSKVEVLPENLKFVKDHHDRIASLLAAKKSGVNLFTAGTHL